MILLQITGLSGSGKTTLASKAKAALSLASHPAIVLDGDEMRKTLSKDLGFEAQDRIENNRRIGDLGLNLMQAGNIVLMATINPYEKCRLELKSKSEHVYTVWLQARIESLIERDPKGLYRKAIHLNTIKLSGINDPYEIPEHPDLVLHTDKESVEVSSQKLLDFIYSKLQMVK